MRPTRFVICAAVLSVITLTGCSRERAPAEAHRAANAGRHALDGQTELFMEYPPLVAGRAALFAVHLTNLDDFKPVNAGQAKVEFTPESAARRRCSRAATFPAGRVPRGRRAPTAGPLPLGAAPRRAGSLRSSRSRHHHSVCRRGGSQGACRAAAA